MQWLKDLWIETMITFHYEAWMATDDREHMLIMTDYIRRRSPRQIARMEARKGLV